MRGWHPTPDNRLTPFTFYRASPTRRMRSWKRLVLQRIKRRLDLEAGHKVRMRRAGFFQRIQGLLSVVQTHVRPYEQPRIFQWQLVPASRGDRIFRLRLVALRLAGEGFFGNARGTLGFAFAIGQFSLLEFRQHFVRKKL